MIGSAGKLESTSNEAPGGTEIISSIRPAGSWRNDMVPENSSL